MMPLMLSLGVISLGLLLLALTLQPVRSTLSLYELQRRQKAGDHAAAAALRREELLAQMEMLRWPVVSLLLVLLTLLLVAAFGWVWGVVGAIIAAFFSARVAKFSFVHRQAQRLYRWREAAVLGMMARHKNKLGFLLGRSSLKHPAASFGSREELFHLITESGTVLSSDDKKLLTHALAFTQRRAKDIMTARDDIVAVPHTELLGPLVLSDLHKTGHSCFPVIVGDLDHVVGTLDIRDLLTLETKRSLTAAKAMTGQAYYIRGDQTLDHAVATFVRTRHHLLVVIDEEGVTLGLLSLRDMLEALFGRPMADEFASDSDLHIVAKRQL